jgi:hypothetical protein
VLLLLLLLLLLLRGGGWGQYRALLMLRLLGRSRGCLCGRQLLQQCCCVACELL